MSARLSSAVVFVIAGLGACGGQAVDLGSNEGKGGSVGPAPGTQNTGGSAGNGSQGEGATGCLPQPNNGAGSGPAPYLGPLVEWPTPETCGGELEPLVGTWTGYVQGPTTFTDEGNFTVSIAAGDGSCGSIAFGSAVSYPPATDAAAIYPPDPPYPPGELGYLTGFAYTLLDATFSNDRLRFRISLSEPWQSWCQLQTPQCDTKWGGYYCSLTKYWNEVGENQCTGAEHNLSEPFLPVSCAQAASCRMSQGAFCQCSADGCAANVNGPSSSFDLHLQSDGAVQGQVDEYSNVWTNTLRTERITNTVQMKKSDASL